jgi:hypothetical protein
MRVNTAAHLCAAVLLAALAAATFPELASGATEKLPHRVPKVESTVVIDGVLDDDVWQRALVMGVNTEVRPGENVPAPVETDMLLAYSETYFYVAFRAHDPDPCQIRARLCDRDRMWDDEWVVIGIDTYNDQRGGFEFACNPLGIQGDTAGGVHGDGNSWDAIWDSAGRIHDWGYAVEMAIPFSSLRFQRSEGDQIWGVDAVRSYPRDVRHHIGLYPRDRDNNCYYCQMEKLIGFARATPGRNIEIDPTISAIASQARPGFTEGAFDDPESEYDVGVTGRWGITPNMTLSGAVNPDFSHVEADAFQLNVNRRDALWYEEKRPFFLEGAGIFDDFYTRSIADPTWGIKLTGKEGENAFGALVARDEITNLIIPGSTGSRSTTLNLESTAAVLRYRRDVGEQSVVDVLLNSRSGDGYANLMGGAEADLWLTDSVHLGLAGLASETSYPDSVADAFGQPGGAFQGSGYSVELGRFTSGLDVYANYLQLGPDFRTDLDFNTRVGFSDAEVGFGHTWYADSDNWWTNLNFGSAYSWREDADGELLSRGYSFWSNYEGQKESFADVSGWIGTESYQGEEFELWNLSYDAGFWPTGWLFVMADGTYGEDIDSDNVRTGRVLALTPRVEAKIGGNLSAELAHTYEQFDVDEARLYTANLTYLKAVYQFSPRVFVRAIAQLYNEGRDLTLYVDPGGLGSEESWLASQILLSYKINPQTVFFLGYSDFHYGDRRGDIVQTDRTLFAKLGYAFVL